MSLPRKASLILWTVRAGQCARTLKTIPAQRRTLWDRAVAQFRYMFGEAKRESFNPQTIEICHRRDKLSTNDWVLIYNDIMHVRFRFLMVCLIPTAISTLTLAIYEYRKNNGKFTNEKLEKLRRDANEAGAFRYVIFFLMSCSATMLIRNLQLRIYRIYQNIQDPYKYYVFRSKSLIFSEWAMIPRSSVKATEVLYDYAERMDTTNKVQRVLRRWTYGHANIGGKAAIIEEMFFKRNNYRTFILHETNTVPLQIVDMQKKLIEAKR